MTMPSSIGIAASSSRRGAAQSIFDGPPFGGLRHRLDDDELRALLVAPMQLRVNGPGESVRVAYSNDNARVLPVKERSKTQELGR